MLTVVDLRGDAGDPLARLPRAAIDRDLARETVREIIAAVRAGGDAAALEQQERFGARPPSLRVSAKQIEAARAGCSAKLLDAIVGAGTIYVTLAKHEVCMDVGVGGFAGPTEVAIVADDTAPPAFIAADLVAQAEHDPLATALLITPSEALIAAVGEALEKEVASCARREDVETALHGQGRAVLVEDLDRAIEVANAFAPEHLELVTADAAERVTQVRDAGATFVGGYSPVALGDPVRGTHHVRPTAGTARFASPLRVSTFVKSTAIIAFERAGLDTVAPVLVQIAEAEGLDAHARALRIRLES